MRLLAFCTQLFMVLIFGSMAHADILFMDLNAMPKEIEAAQRAAAKRGERLHIIPNLTAAQKAGIRNAQETVRRAEEYAASQCRDGAPAGACRAAEDAFFETIMRENQKLPQVDKDYLKKELKKLASENVKLSSVVISGHDGNGQFVGSQGRLSDKDISEAFQSSAPLGDSVRSLLLWGCYTTNIGSLEKNWKPILPGLNMIAGFDKIAPAGDKAPNWTYLEDVLVKEKALTETADSKSLMNVFKSIRGVNVVAASICLNKDRLVTNKGVSSVRKEIEKCQQLQTGKLSERLQCYEKAEPGCEDIPADTANGPVRKIYNEIQESKHCQDYLPAHMSIPNADATLRLIFDKRVRTNFEARNQEGLKDLNSLLRELKFADRLQFKDLGNMSRKEFLDRITSVEAEIERRSQLIKDDFDRIDDPKLLALKEAIASVKGVSQVSKRGPVCVPFEWVEPNARNNDYCGWTDKLKTSREVGERTAYSVRYERLDEAAVDEMAGPKMVELRKQLIESKRRASTTFANNMSADSTKLYQEVSDIEDQMRDLRKRTAPSYVDSRIEYYKSKLQSSENLAPLEKKVLAEQLRSWEVTKIRENDKDAAADEARRRALNGRATDI